MRRRFTLSLVFVSSLLISLFTAANALALATEKVLYTFTDGADGAWPKGRLVMDSAGNLYGTAQYGGDDTICAPSGCGVAFKLSPNPDGTWNYSVIHTFVDTDGAGPIGGLTIDAAGNLYGTTAFGGPSFSGNVFKLSPNLDGSWTESVLYTFTDGIDGGIPLSEVVLDAAGNVYGTTQEGGTSSHGTVFKLMPSVGGSWTESVLISFTGGLDGGAPQSKLVLDASGNLYGTAPTGGSHAHGVVFELSPATGGAYTETVLYNFAGHQDGATPIAGLAFDSSGNLYGTASAGGGTKSCKLGCGTAFRLTRSSGSWTFNLIHVFGGAPGTTPTGQLVFDSAGNLWGTTSGIAVKSDGTVFKLSPTSAGRWQYSVPYIFGHGNDGSVPQAGVVADSVGNVFGTTISNSACYLCGVVFQVTP